MNVTAWNDPADVPAAVYVAVHAAEAARLIPIVVKEIVVVAAIQLTFGVFVGVIYRVPEPAPAFIAAAKLEADAAKFAPISTFPAVTPITVTNLNVLFPIAIVSLLMKLFVLVSVKIIVPLYVHKS